MRERVVLLHASIMSNFWRSTDPRRAAGFVRDWAATLHADPPVRGWVRGEPAHGIASDDAGLVYVLDTGNRNVQVFDYIPVIPEGGMTTRCN